MAASEILQRYRTSIAITTGTSLTADTLSSAIATVVNTNTGQNASGATALKARLKTPTPPSTATACTLYMSSSDDGSAYEELQPVAIFTGITTAANLYYTAWVQGGVPPYAKFALKPIGYNMTVELNIVPVYTEAQ